jgi:hypothetical protein
VAAAGRVGDAALPLQVVADGHSTAVYGALISLNGVVVTMVELPRAAVTRRFPARMVPLARPRYATTASRSTSAA